MPSEGRMLRNMTKRKEISRIEREKYKIPSAVNLEKQVEDEQ